MGIRRFLACGVLSLMAISLLTSLDLPIPDSNGSIPAGSSLTASATAQTSQTLPSAPAATATVIPVGSDLADVAIDAIRPRAYIADRANDRILVLGLDNDTVFRNISVRAEPVALAINPSSDTLYVGHAGNMSIQVIDLTSLSVVRTLDTAFSAWDLAAPTDTSLVATTHSDQTREYVHVLDANDGRVIQDLCWGPVVCNAFSPDSIVALNADRQWLFVADSALTVPILLVSYYRDARSDGWSRVNESLSTDWGAIGGFARDLGATPDGAFVYVASDYKTATRVNASDFRSVQDLGSFSHSYSVALAPSGAPIALAGSDGSLESERTLQVVDSDGDYLADIPVSGPAERVRLTADGLRFVATVGATTQDIALVNSTAIRPWGPREYENTVAPFLSAQVAAFVPLSELTATLTVDGTPVTESTFNTTTGWLSGVADQALAEGRHTLVMTVSRGSIELASLSRDFWVDLTPPDIQLDPFLPITSVSSFTISGRVVDLKTRAAVNISGQWALLDAARRFSITLELQPGNTTIFMFTYDEAGNYAEKTITIDFEPPIEWFTHPAKHFRIRVPYRWAAFGNVTAGGDTADVLLDATGFNANVVVVSENRTLAGTAAEARTILQEAIDNLSAMAGFQILQPVVNRTIDGHPAASVYLTWQPSTYNIYQMITVVVDGNWDMFWGLAGTMFSWDADKVGPTINATIDSFDVFVKTSPPPVENPPYSEAPFPWLFAGGVVAAGAGGAVVLAVHWLRRRRPPLP